MPYHFISIAFIFLGWSNPNAFGQNDCLRNQRVDSVRNNMDTIVLLGGLIDLVEEVNPIKDVKTNFEIRLYSEGRIPGSRHKMVRISCLNGQLIAKQYQYEDVYSLKNDSITDYSAKILDGKQLICQIPLASFVDSLITHRFLTLPPMSKKNYVTTDTLFIDGQELYRTSMPYILDGSRYTYQYKIGPAVYSYEYENPESYLELFPKDEHLIRATEIIQLFRTYFKESY